MPTGRGYSPQASRESSAGLKSSAAIGFGLKEGEASEAPDALARRFARQFFRDGTAIVLTRASEGSDGRAIRRALEIAIAHCTRRGQEIAVIDMPSTDARGREDVVLSLDASEEALKRRMLACFSASRLRQQFYAAEECFRLVPADELDGAGAAKPGVRALPEVELQATA